MARITDQGVPGVRTQASTRKLTLERVRNPRGGSDKLVPGNSADRLTGQVFATEAGLVVNGQAGRTPEGVMP